MDRVIASNSVGFGSHDTVPGSGTPGMFTVGNPVGPIPATLVPGYWLNMLQEELRNVVLDAGITPSGSDWTQLLQALKARYRVKLLSNLALFVATSGSDANNGLSAGSPFATLQKAWNLIVSNLDLNGFSVTVSVANGTYTSGLVASGTVVGLGTGNVVSFVGNVGTPSSVIISTTNAHAIMALNGAAISVSGFQLAAGGTVSGAGAAGIFSTTSASVNVGSGGSNAMIYGTCAGYHLWATQTALIAGNSMSYTVTGSAQGHVAASGGGSVVFTGPTITVLGTPAFSLAFASAGNLALISITGSAISGAATGVRYSVTSNAVINTGGGGPNVFPGSSVGAFSTGGQYL